MRRKAKEVLNRTSRKCTDVARRSLDLVFESAYKLTIENPLPEEPEHSPKSYACLAFSHAVCAPLSVSAWALRRAAKLADTLDDEDVNDKQSKTAPFSERSFCASFYRIKLRV